jgi:hypothetical protein
MMVPHHQGAIEMAQAELRHGRNERLRRMAQEIIITQLQETAAMRLSLGQALPPSVASPDLIPLARLTIRNPYPWQRSRDMRPNVVLVFLLVATGLVGIRDALAGQVPAAASDPDIPISHQDRVYSAEQYSNTISVTDPVDNKLVGIIHLGDPLPANLSPLYKGQLLVHGMGFSPDHRTIVVVAIGCRFWQKVPGLVRSSRAAPLTGARAAQGRSDDCPRRSAG